MDCPHGHGPMLRGQKAWLCEECGARRPLADAVAPPLPPLGEPDLQRLPYPVALTAGRLRDALLTSPDVLKVLFLLKDAFEASVKFLGAVLLVEYRRSPAATPERNEVLLQKLVRPALGVWVNDVAGNLGHWLLDQGPPAGRVAALFARKGKSGRAEATPLLEQCREFVTYRNNALGHGALRPERTYRADLADWLPMLRQLLAGMAELSEWRLSLATDVDRCQVWMGPAPSAATEPGSFGRERVGHFLLRGPGREGEAPAEPPLHDLYPFLCYLPAPDQEQRLHFYDSLYRYQPTKKEATVLEYDRGERHPRPEPVPGLEEAFTDDLLAEAFKWHRGRMAVIEGRVANFGEILETHAAIVGRRFAIERVQRFLADNDRGLLVIEGEPGKGKTALLAHLIEEVFGHCVPRPVHFFYRRTAGITDPDVCVRSLYHALLEAHDLTEADESRLQDSPELVYTKLVNLLGKEIAPRLTSGRPQIIFIDALDEADRNAFLRIPENLAVGVYVIASARPVTERTTLARRPGLHWFNLDHPDLLQVNLRDGAEYVQRELVPLDLPAPTQDEIARLGAGNFLVLKLLCQHVRTRLEPEEVPLFLRRLATGGGEDQLGFIYAEFWRRLTERCSRDEVSLLCDVAGVLVSANAPLTAEVVCEVLGLRAGDWDFALHELAEYLSRIADEEDAACERYYRLYHESFADFVRTKVSMDRRRLDRLLADYCTNWSCHLEGYPQTYSLRFGPTHLLTAEHWKELSDLLCSEEFVSARETIDRPFPHALTRDYREALVRLPDPWWQRLWEAPLPCTLCCLRGLTELLDFGALGRARVLLARSADLVVKRQVSELTSLWYCLAGRIALANGDSDEAARCLSHALVEARASGFAEGVAKALLATGVLLARAADRGRRGYHTLEEALEADYSRWNADFRCRVLLNLAMVHVRTGEPQMAQKALDRARLAAEQGGRPILEAWLLKYEGFTRFLQREFEAAAERFQRAGTTFREFGNAEEAHRCEQLHLYASVPGLCATISERLSTCNFRTALTATPRYFIGWWVRGYRNIKSGFRQLVLPGLSLTPQPLPERLKAPLCFLLILALSLIGLLYGLLGLPIVDLWGRRFVVRHGRNRVLQHVSALQKVMHVQTGMPEDSVVQQTASGVHGIEDLVRAIELRFNPQDPADLY